MLEMAMVLVLLSTLVIPLGADYANLASTTRDVGVVFLLAWLVAGAVAVILYRPLDRRLLHHA